MVPRDGLQPVVVAFPSHTSHALSFKKIKKTHQSSGFTASGSAILKTERKDTSPDKQKFER